MSRSRMPLLLGLLLALGLALLVVVGVALQAWVLTAVGAAGFASAILVVQLDTWRRTRSMRNYLRDEIRRGAKESGSLVPGPRAPAPPTVSDEDVLGAVRLMQAQYTGRLDRMQAAVDDAVGRLATQDRPEQ